MFTAVFVSLDEGVWIMARMTLNNAKYFPVGFASPRVGKDTYLIKFVQDFFFTIV